MSEKRASMCPDEVREIVRETVHETLTKLGAQVENPLESQADFRWLRSARRASDSMRSKGFLAALALIGTLIVTLLTAGVKSLIRGHS